MAIKVLLVDDHTVLLEGMKRIIELEEDMQVIAIATNGVEAIDLAKKLKPDVVIMDINMPQMDGVKATQIIKQLSPDTEVLILTMFDKEEYLFAVIKAGASGYLLKDAPSEEVVQAVRVVANGESMLTPSMAKKLITLCSTQSLPTVLKKEAVDTPTINMETNKKETNHDSLSPRELEVLYLLVDGKTNQEIADTLCISDKTVKIHVNKIYKKLNVKSRSQAIIYAIQQQVVNIV
ncbi:response regulator transcription factor [Caldalkalibacillus mannanilyticus]|uniref:response regulator transcription factor n=1 Tax=Caldalkalibacillus mannanilyticus TaxID=1418 RepID=UPI0004698FDD|nr:response regulator transcription factor [Caldalkalibacillus mannanilyticus]